MAECAKGVYRPRRPRETAFYRLVEEHYESFEQVYPERYEDRYGFFRPVIRETVYMGSWAHSGFNVNATVRIGADDATGRENLARYLIRAPFSMNKIRYDPKARSVIYKTKMVAGANRNFEVFDPLDFIAALTAHIPNRGEHLVRYYGYYSSVQRGRRRRDGRENVAFRPLPSVDEAPHAKAARASWARFLKKVFAADPLVCPDCGGAMRIIAFIEEQRVVRAILEHLSLWDEPRPPPALPAASGAPVELEYLPWVD